MARIYLSSTYEDLKDYREAVNDQLVKMKHVVIAMEHYVATDERPLDKCLDDVASCDLYIGIFAWRYGYVPTDQNPESLSISELEYRKAVDAKKSPLIFLLDPKAQWTLSMIDSVTKENEEGRKIAKLRADLEKITTRSYFSSPLQLASLVSAAVANWQNEKQVIKQSIAPPSNFRAVSNDVFVAYLDADETSFLEWSKLMAGRALKVQGSSQSLLADTDGDFLALERTLRQCHTALVFLSEASLNQLKQRVAQTETILQILRARTKTLIAVWRGDVIPGFPQTWSFDNTFLLNDSDAKLPTASASHIEIERIIRSRKPRGGGRMIGLPIVIVAMNRSEAESLVNNPAELKRRSGTTTFEQFVRIKEAVESNGIDLISRYEKRREDWKPFIDSPVTALDAIEWVVGRLNEKTSSQLRDSRIKLQHYPLDLLISHPEKLRDIYLEIANTGCVVVVDELSMFHWDIRHLLQQTYLNREQVALVTISPVDPCSFQPTPNQVLETELRTNLGDAFDRFSRKLDPQCEFGVNDERRLKRWLNISLPQTVRNLLEPRPDPQAMQQFFGAEVSREGSQGMSSFLYSADDST